MMHNRSLLAIVVFLGACVPNEQGYIRASKSGDLGAGQAPRAPFDASFAASCGSGELTGAGAATLLRAPYVQRVSSTSAALLWTHTANADLTVEVSLPDGTPAAKAIAAVDPDVALPEGRPYEAVLENLHPNTLYCYEVHGADGALTERTGFRTAPLPGDPEPVRFISFGDLGTQTLDQFAVLGALEGVAFDFALVNGDVAYDSGTLQQFESNFFDVYSHMLRSIPFFAAAGNHDYKTRGGQPFRDVFALFENGGPEGRERWYSFDWGPVHIAVLNSQEFSDAQARWLDADLANSDAPWTIAMLHKPPYSSGYHGSSSAARDTFEAIFVAHGVDVVLAGHDHNYERTHAIDGVTYIVSGAGGRGTRPVGSSSFTAFSEQVSHFTYFIADEHSLTLWAIDGTGAEFDTLMLTR